MAILTFFKVHLQINTNICSTENRLLNITSKRTYLKKSYCYANSPNMSSKINSPLKLNEMYSKKA